MDAILDFFRAASPWVAMGLLLAIFFVRSAVKKKKGKKQDGDYGKEFEASRRIWNNQSAFLHSHGGILPAGIPRI